MSTSDATQTKENPLGKMARDGSSRMEQMVGEVRKFEEQQHQRAVEMIDESARMVKTSVEHSIKLAEDMRKMALEANRQAMEFFTTKWF